ncbi:MAG: Asp-tRNA(Asn)/Glu-tRNA(Gln) amidotransferase GatCAB subunit A [Rhodospirillaceae bacterium]|nr:Asp-tRNA(Asn)/Glu-tRNA(Gln) amidotransferase GatCAB subunit A [Rhodospirillaceae bacterium]|tara:strand:- start:12967 stop:14424 length:1458 start_codon:yes stop_codon:yes gene_type:complete
MHEATIAHLSEKLRDHKISSKELTTHFLARISRLDAKLNSFITITEREALAQAEVADARLKKGDTTPLTGIPIAHKDIFCTEGVKTSCGSLMLDNFISPYDATVTARLKSAGAVMLGKTNMDEFAMGSSNETSYYGLVRNPWNYEKVPGGSSGGSAAAVAARLASGATGTDTGGSIRQPAALTGITGLKPTYGRISRYGMVAFASSLDQAGTLTKTAEDAALMLQAMAGFDERDSTALQETVPDYLKAINGPWQKINIGIPSNFFDDGLDEENAELVRKAVTVFEKLGASIKEIHLENLHLSVPTYYVVASAEASSNLSRFDGVRFGHRAKEAKDLTELYMKTRGEGFGPEVKRRILTGTYVLSAGYYDAYYLQAQKVRQLISQDFARAFDDVDIIVGPTTPTPAFNIGQKTEDPIQMYLNDIYTIGANLAGLPALSIPCGFVENLPVGLQLIGPHLGEEVLLKAGHYYQKETDWHKQVPPVHED